MKKFTKVCLMIAAVMGGVGILLCGIAGAAGMRSKPGEVKQALEETGVYDDEDGFHIGFTDNWLGKLITQAVKIKNSDRYQISELERGNESAEETFDADAMKFLELSADMADITLKTAEGTDKVTVSMEYGYKRFFSCKMNGNTLVISYEQTSSAKKGPEIIVTVPKNFTLEEATLTADMGDITIEKNVLSCRIMTLTADMGNISIKGADVEKLSATADMGNITFYGSASKTLFAEADMGNVDLFISNSYKAYNYDISCDMGTVKLNGKNYGDYDGKTVIENEDATADMELSCDMGNITVKFE